MTTRGRLFSSPDIAASSSSHRVDAEQQRPADDTAAGRFEGYGIAANVKLLLKLIQENNEASARDQDDRKPQRVAGMISILDDVRTRIQRSQTINKRSLAELRRCNTDLRPHRGMPKDNNRVERKPSQEPMSDEKEKLRRELSASLVARKSLEVMCSSLGKEKEIMASELAKRVQELNESEELINDLKKQNETLSAKVQACAAEHKEKKCSGGEAQGNAALQERNKALSEQLLKSLDGYRSLKRKYKNAQEENAEIQSTMEEMKVEAAAGLERIRGFRKLLSKPEVQPADIEGEISALEHLFQSLNTKISKHIQESTQPKVGHHAS